MLLAKVLLMFSMMAQTKLDMKTQTKGTNIKPNLYFTTVTASGDVQLMPGIFFTRLMQRENATPPPTSASKCNVVVDGNSHEAYEFARTGSVILTETHMYVCLSSNTWKRIPMEAF